jgi:hypothetical protein
MSYYIAKSRSTYQGTKYITRTDFARNRTHGFGLPCNPLTPESSQSEEIIKLTLIDQPSLTELDGQSKEPIK